MKKLSKPDEKTYKKDLNELSEPMAILECRSGPQAGSKRLILNMVDFSKVFKDAPAGFPVSIRLDSSFNSGTYELDPGTHVDYDYDVGIFSFSSDKTRYIIRAVQDYDEIIGEPID